MTDDHSSAVPSVSQAVRLGEDWEAGLYLDARTPVTTVTTTWRDPSTPPSAAPQVVEEHYVSAQTFMEVQKERDELQRVLALINGWRMSPGRDENRLRTLLASVGHNDAMGEAVLDVIRWAQSERRATAAPD